jgi:pyridoxine 4-dehydrogenase
VSEVTLDELRRVRQLVDVATVQNRFNLAEQGADDVLVECESDGLTRASARERRCRVDRTGRR